VSYFFIVLIVVVIVVLVLSGRGYIDSAFSLPFGLTIKTRPKVEIRPSLLELMKNVAEITPVKITNNHDQAYFDLQLKIFLPEQVDYTKVQVHPRFEISPTMFIQGMFGREATGLKRKIFIYPIESIDPNETLTLDIQFPIFSGESRKVEFEISKFEKPQKKWVGDLTN